MGRRVVGRILGTIALAATLAVAGLGTATAAPSGGPDPVRRLTAPVGADPDASTHPRTGVRQALRVPGVPAEQAAESYLGVAPSCAKGSGKARPNAVVVATRKLTLGWSLTGPNQLHATGKVKVKKDRETALKLPRVRAGGYRVVLTIQGRSTVVADQTFEVLRCVTIKARCRTLTFTNPAGNPDALVDYGRRSPADFEVEVAAGTSRTVRVDDRKVRVNAYSTGDDLGDLGSARVKVKQSCAHGPATPAQNAVQTTGGAECASARPAALTLVFSAQASLKNRRWEILDSQSRVVARGTYRNRGRASVSLPAGTYAYRSYANSATRPFEDVSFTVLGCLTVKPRCRALDVTNPNAVPVELLLFSPDDDVDPDDLVDPPVIAASATTSIPWTARTASYVGFPEGLDDGARITGLATELPGGDLPEVRVPQTC